jgi:hypothetical protein
MSSAKDEIGMCKGQLDNREDWVEEAKVGGESEVVCAVADAGFNNKRAKTSVRQFR